MTNQTTHQTNNPAITWVSKDKELDRLIDGEIDGTRILAKGSSWYVLAYRPCFGRKVAGMQYDYWICQDTVQKAVDKAEAILLGVGV